MVSRILFLMFLLYHNSSSIFVYRIGFPGVSTSPSFAHAMHVHIVSPRARCAEMMAPRSSNGGGQEEMERANKPRSKVHTGN